MSRSDRNPSPGGSIKKSLLASVLSCNSTALIFAWTTRIPLVPHLLFTLGLTLLGTLFAVSIKSTREGNDKEADPGKTRKKFHIFHASVFFVGTLAACATLNVITQNGQWWMMPIYATGMALYSGLTGQFILVAIGKDRILPDRENRNNAHYS